MHKSLISEKNLISEIQKCSRQGAQPPPQTPPPVKRGTPPPHTLHPRRLDPAACVVTSITYFMPCCMTFVLALWRYNKSVVSDRRCYVDWSMQVRMWNELTSFATRLTCWTPTNACWSVRCFISLRDGPWTGIRADCVLCGKVYSAVAWCRIVQT